MRRVLALIMCLMLVSAAVGCSAPATPTNTDAPATRSPAVTPEIESGVYTPGTYTGVGQGMNGEVSVNVTFSADAITAIEIGNHAESAGISDPAIAQIPQAIIDSQSLNVDVVAGASMTSRAILEAVKEAVTQAGGDLSAMGVIEGEKTEIAADLVVVGAGVAGISAALQADEAGIENIVLLEQTETLGGSAFVSGGVIQGTGSKAQAKRGLTDDTPADVAAYWNGMGENRVNTLLVNKVAELSGSSIDWIEGMGVKFDEELSIQGEATVARANG